VDLTLLDATGPPVAQPAGPCYWLGRSDLATSVALRAPYVAKAARPCRAQEGFPGPPQGGVTFLARKGGHVW
jgi:hypothetical protein